MFRLGIKENDLRNINDWTLDELVQRNTDHCWPDSNISGEKVRRWLSNFDGSCLGDIEYEHKIAKWLLSNFVYYNQSEIRYLCKLSFYRLVHEIINNPDEECTEASISKIVDETQFKPIGKSSESGSLILYFFRQACNLPYILDVRTPKRVVFIDDLLLSGDQIIDYQDDISRVRVENKYLIHLISTKNAIQRIRPLGCHHISPVKADERSEFVSSKDSIFSQFINNYNDAYTFVTYYGRQCFSSPLGHGDKGLLISTFYNTPDNTLPIFWSKENNWKPLFAKHSKRYENEEENYDNSTFI